MAPRCLNLSELTHVRWLAAETMRRRRPRRASRVRTFAQALPPAVPSIRPSVPVLYRVRDGLLRLSEVAA